MMSTDRGTIKDTHMLDYMDQLKVGECMIARTKILGGRVRKYVIVRVNSDT